MAGIQAPDVCVDIFRGGQCCADLCRMMCIIIDNRDAIYASFILETSSAPPKAEGPCKNVILLEDL